MRGLKMLIFQTLLLNVVSVSYLLYHVSTGKQIIRLDSSMSKQVDIIVKGVVGLILGWLMLQEWFPLYRDIPNLMNKNFYIILGESQSECHFNSKSFKGSYSVIKDDKTGEEVRVTFFYKGNIKEGDHLTVQYLPNSKCGVLLEINGEPYNRKIE